MENKCLYCDGKEYIEEYGKDPIRCSCYYQTPPIMSNTNQPLTADTSIEQILTEEIILCVEGHSEIGYRIDYGGVVDKLEEFFDQATAALKRENEELKRKHKNQYDWIKEKQSRITDLQQLNEKLMGENSKLAIDLENTVHGANHNAAIAEKLMGLLETQFIIGQIIMLKRDHPTWNHLEIKLQAQSDWQSFRKEHGLNS